MIYTYFLQLISLFIGLSLTPLAYAQVIKEYQVKAAFLYNFTNFIYWNEDAFKTQNSFNICIFGKNPFGDLLTIATENKFVAEQPITIEEIDQTSQIKTCHILFISQSEKKQLNTILKESCHYNILTVSDIEDFGQQGGMITFLNQENRIRLVINLNVLTHANLKADANLLRLSIVNRDEVTNCIDNK